MPENIIRINLKNSSLNLSIQIIIKTSNNITFLFKMFRIEKLLLYVPMNLRQCLMFGGHKMLF